MVRKVRGKLLLGLINIDQCKFAIQTGPCTGKWKCLWGPRCRPCRTPNYTISLLANASISRFTLCHLQNYLLGFFLRKLYSPRYSRTRSNPCECHLYFSSFVAASSLHTACSSSCETLCCAIQMHWPTYQGLSGAAWLLSNSKYNFFDACKRN